MGSDSTFEIGARIDHLSDGVGCFDPMQVMCRMRASFPELIEESRDYLWETADRLRQMARGGSEGAEAALHIALRDMQERGPKILFRIPLPNGRSIRGTAERYCVFVTCSEDFPEDFRRRFTHFLRGLSLQPIQVA